MKSYNLKRDDYKNGWYLFEKFDEMEAKIEETEKQHE